MKSGRVIRSFDARDGRRVVLRTLKWDDLEDCLEFINSLVDEKANILRDQKVTREAEIEWLAKALSRMELEEVVYLVAEVDGKVVASSELSRRLSGYDKHLGSIGIAIKNGFRDLGIGTEMMKTLIEQGKSWGLKALTLTAFANNARALHVYRKIGFVETGRIPKRFFKEGQYIDEVVLIMPLE
jgi:RimJ/RimL family protein N-acetyltransferase